MTAKQWLKAFQKALAPLPRAERERAADYYAELFADRAEAGEAEETIARELGEDWIKVNLNGEGSNILVSAKI